MKKRPLHHKLLKLHRWIGLFAAILVLLLAVTGIALEHTEDFGLDQTYIANSAVLDYYGIKPDPITHYATGSAHISHSGTRLYFNESALGTESALLCGAIALPAAYAICNEEGILLLDTDGEEIEQLSTDLSLPAPASGLGMTSSRQLVLLSHEGNWLADNDLLLWQPYDSDPSMVSISSQPPSDLNYKIQAHSVSNEISLERLLLDLHSGRLLGRWGVYAMDLASLALIYLALSGVWVWWKRGRR